MTDEVTTKPKRKTTTSAQVKRRYMDKTYTRVYADLPKELAANFKAATAAHGSSAAEVIRKAVEQFLAENPAPSPRA